MNELRGRSVKEAGVGSGLGGESGRGECLGDERAVLVGTPGSGVEIPNPEVEARAQRRRFSAAYKARVVEEAERCTECGAVGALLRREGLYSSHLSKWREQYRRGALAGLRDDKRGRPSMRHPLEDEVAKLRKENARLSGRLAQAELIIEIQKKVAAVLGIPLNSTENGE